MEKIPTAKKFMQDQISNNPNATSASIMRDFAKLHVEAAIKECIESAPSGSSTDTVSYEDVKTALTDCYPLTNIK